MTMTQDRMTFSFRCPKTLKDAFASKAKANGTTASALIKDFMQAYIDGSYDNSTDTQAVDKEQSTDTEKQSTDHQDDGAENERIDELEMAIAALQTELADHQQQLNGMTEAIECQDNAYDNLWNEVRSQRGMMDGVSCPLPPLPEELPSNDNVPADQIEDSESTELHSEVEWTTSELAEEYAISPQNLTNWRTGKSQPRGKNASLWRQIQEAFQYDSENKKWILRR